MEKQQVSEYYLNITFNSNENPFNTHHFPISWMPPVDDEAAIDWARSMSVGMGSSYTVTLFKDKEVLEY